LKWEGFVNCFYRIHAIPFHDNEKSQLKDPCSFDVLVNENDRLVSQGAVCGFSGSLIREPLWPFVYFPESGKVDFGTAFDGKDRLYWTNLKTTTLRIGKTFHFGPMGSQLSPKLEMKITRKPELT